MTKIYTIIVKTLVGPLCVSADDGQKLHDAIAEVLRAKRRVSVNFEGVSILISAFLNAAIGQLYGEFAEDVIRENLGVAGLGPEDLTLLKLVVDNAKVYFHNRKSFDRAWKSELNDE